MPHPKLLKQDNWIRQRHLCEVFLTAELTSLIDYCGVHCKKVIFLKRGVQYRRLYRGDILNIRPIRQSSSARNHPQDCWNNVIFSDESRYKLFNADRRIRNRDAETNVTLIQCTTISSKEPSWIRQIVENNIWSNTTVCQSIICDNKMFEWNVSQENIRQAITDQLLN
jgi:hypothetical protein